jgi:hypothetical protein
VNNESFRKGETVDVFLMGWYWALLMGVRNPASDWTRKVKRTVRIEESSGRPWVSLEGARAEIYRHGVTVLAKRPAFDRTKLKPANAIELDAMTAVWNSVAGHGRRR